WSCSTSTASGPHRPSSGVGERAMFGVMRTGVRLVMTNPADPRRVEDYAAWYDAYGAALTGPGFLANAFRFENSGAAGTEDDPRFVAVYDIVTSDPAMAWPQTVG